MCPDYSPRRHGFCQERLKNIDEWMQDHIDEGRLPGVAVQITRGGEIVYRNKCGLRDIEADIPEERRKVVNAERFKGTLTIFSEMYASATPAERKELMQLHIHQLEWTPNRIRMAVYETPTEPALVNHNGKGSMGGINWLHEQRIH